MVRTLEVTFDASGAAEAGRRGRVVCVVDVVDSATSAEAALAHGAVAVFGAAPAGAMPPVPVEPEGPAKRAAEAAREHGTDVVVAAEPRVGPDQERLARAQAVTDVLAAAGVEVQVVPNQGAELSGVVELRGRVVVVVSTTGGTAFDAALAAGAPAVCFATTARVEGRTGWQVADLGAERAAALAEEHDAGLSIVAASANSADDCLAAWEIATRLVRGGFLRP